MAESVARRRWRPTPVGLIAGSLVILGLVLMEIDGGFLALAALGTFGPGILRELGLLRDRDEFQLRAAHRAGHHAYLVTGLIAFLLVAFVRSKEPGPVNPEPLITAFLVILWFTWLLSSLLAYWGPRRTASRLLMVFGSVWLVFAVLSNLGPEYRGILGVLIGASITLPFFALAYTARRWPRITGGILLACSAFFFYFFKLYEIFEHPLEMGRPVVLVLFLGPLLASGIALLGVDSSEDESEEDGGVEAAADIPVGGAES
jgi:hypothetical protein